MAERTAEALGLGRVARAADALTGRLATRHGIKVLQAGPERSADARRFDADSGLLLLSPWLGEGQRAFQPATQLAPLEYGPLLTGPVEAAGPSPPQADGLARIGLANYFAGALLMPPGRILTQVAEMPDGLRTHVPHPVITDH
ncbi:ImmA/IrrE family metallo-endopeptidase [Streptomyces sp. NC-S4]